MSPGSVVASLTTIPSRLPYLKNVLNSILSDRSFNIIFLNIPLKTRKGKEYPQDVIDELVTAVDSPRLVVNRIQKDYGPITKLVGCLNVVTDPNTTVVVFDDDRELLKPIGRVFQERCVSNPARVYSLGGWCFGSGYRIHVENIEDVIVDSVMGTTCIAFRRDIFDKDALLAFHEDDVRLVNLDDLRISAYLASRGIQRISIGLNAREYLRDIRYPGTESLSGSFEFWRSNKSVIDKLTNEGLFGVKSTEGSSFEIFVVFVILCVLLFIGGLIAIYRKIYYVGYGLIFSSLLFGGLAAVQLQSFIL